MENLAFQGLVGLSVAMYLWLLAAGLTIVFGVLGVLNFAHGSLFMLGAYFAFTFYGLWGVNFWLAIALSLLTAILEVREIVTRYGQSQVLHGVSLVVGQGEVVSLLGRNGVGKTTTFRSIMGLTPPRSGSILLKGTELVGRKPFEIARLGIGYIRRKEIIVNDLRKLTLTVRHSLKSPHPPFGKGGRGGFLIGIPESR